MALTIEKNIGSPRTINTVQKKRQILSVTEFYNATNNLYAVNISYREYEVDAGNAVVSDTTNSLTLNDAQLNAAAKSEIDSIFTRALGAI